MEIDKERLHFLENFLSARRISRLKTVLEQRTRYIVCVVENLYDSRNGSAIIRHCDALGIQEIHAIANKNRFRTDRQVDLGTSQWLDVMIYNLEDETPVQSAVPGHGTCTPEVLRTLKQRGFRIVATSLQTDKTVSPETLDLVKGPIAVVFGTEKHGISDDVKKQADEFLHIPMVGFVDSFNISAAAAIILYVLSTRIRQEHLPWPLELKDAMATYFRWVETSVRHSKALLGRFEENLRADNGLK
ncbi:MAG: hypothetical protein B6D68_03555 [spirochete symbiont of Stewartia floridana]|nr:MAG: hypothetical protein B6D68_03555 [spirochete symbiont of Stewartia floridana]